MYKLCVRSQRNYVFLQTEPRKIFAIYFIFVYWAPTINLAPF